MAKTEYVYFKGKASWAKLITPDIEYNNWNVKLNFDKDSYNAFMALKEKQGEVEGILNEVKKDDDGYYHTFKRPVSRDFGKGVERLTPPVVIGADGEPFEQSIGNGSDVTVKCEMYTYTNKRTKKRGKAIRLEGVKIDNLVPYTRKDFTLEQEELVKGLQEQPAPVAW